MFIFCVRDKALQLFVIAPLKEKNGVKSCFVPFLCWSKGMDSPLSIEYTGALYHVISR